MKIAILSLLQDIDPGYAVATVTLSHIRMLKEQGHEVLLLTSEDSILKAEDVGCEVRCELPVWQLHDYTMNEPLKEEDTERIVKIKEVISRYTDYVLIEHDFILQGWYYPHGLATTYFNNIWHVIHSKVGSTPVKKLPNSHKVIVLDDSLIEATEKHYEASSRVFCIPNPVDILEFNDAEEETKKMVKEWGLLDYDYIFTYPFCATRWSAKGADFFALFTKYMENQGLKVAGVFLMSHANSPDFKIPVWDTCHFSNVMFKEYNFGVSKKVVRDFMWLSDGFLLPSHAETSSLVYKEAALAKNPVILNRLLKLNSKASTANLMRKAEDNYEVVLQQFLKESKHLDDFRFIRKNLNENSVGKQLSNLLQRYA